MVIRRNPNPSLSRRAAFAFATCMASCGLIAIPAAHAQIVTPQKDEAGLAQAEQARLDAQVHQDAQTLAGVIADEAIYIHANGALQTKAEYLNAVKSGMSKYRSIEASDRVTTLYGDIGLTHGKIVLNVGVDKQITALYSGTYVWRDGHWQVLVWQTTPVQPRSDQAPKPANAGTSAPVGADNPKP